MSRTVSREGKNCIDTILYVYSNPLSYLQLGVMFSIECFIFKSIKKSKFFSLKRDNSDCFIEIDEVPKHYGATIPSKLDKTGIKKDVSIYINNFVKTLKNRPNIDLYNFYKNFHAFCITREKRNRKEKEVLGRFYPRRGKRNFEIELYTDKLTDALYHELLHMASTTYGPDFECIGFSRTKWDVKKKLYELGDGLNEGYTELLTKRYFRQQGEVECYTVLTDLSYAIELLVGQEKMESLYFKGDLLGLIDELSSFLPKKDAIKLIRDIDIYYHMVHGKEIYSNKFKKQIHGEILLTLAKIMLKEIDMSSKRLNEKRANALLDWVGNLRLKSEVLTNAQKRQLEKMIEEYNSKLEPIDTPISNEENKSKIEQSGTPNPNEDNLTIEDGMYSLDRIASEQMILIDSIPDWVKKDGYSTPLSQVGIKKKTLSYIKDFIKTLKKEPNIDLSNLYRNFHSGCFIEKELGNETKGTYDYKNLNILYSPGFLSKVIHHELLHMSSSYTVDEYYAVGFSREYRKGEYAGNVFAHALNEGYTQLLTERYFKNYAMRAYTKQVNIVMGIESLVGENKMESLYFKGDLKGLINSLSNLITQEEFVKLIILMDLINDNSNPALSISIYSYILLKIAEMIEKQLKQQPKNSNRDYQLCWLKEVDTYSNYLFTDEDKKKFKIIMVQIEELKSNKRIV